MEKRWLVGLGGLAIFLALSGATPNAARADDDDYVNVGEDTDSNGKWDDTDDNNVPDHKGQAKKGWLISCGVAVGAAYYGFASVAGTSAWKCLQKKGLFEN